MAILVPNQGGFNNVNNSWGFGTTAGRIVVAAMSCRNWNQFYTPKSGWSILSQRNNNPSGSPNAFCAGRFPTINGETTMGGSGFTGNQTGAALEITGALLSDYLDGGPSAGTAGTAATNSITPSRSCVLIAFFASSQSGNWTIPAPWTKVSTDGPPQSESDWPRTAIAYRIVPAPAGASFQATATGSGQWATTIIAVYSDQTSPLHTNVVII